MVSQERRPLQGPIQGPPAGPYPTSPVPALESVAQRIRGQDIAKDRVLTSALLPPAPRVRAPG